MKSKYRSDLDMLKGFAILAVVLYHLGVSRSGYLGVDVFLTLSGFFVVPKAVQEVARGSFRYLELGLPFFRLGDFHLLKLVLQKRCFT